MGGEMISSKIQGEWAEDYKNWGVSGKQYVWEIKGKLQIFLFIFIPSLVVPTPQDGAGLVHWVYNLEYSWQPFFVKGQEVNPDHVLTWSKPNSAIAECSQHCVPNCGEFLYNC